MSLPPIRWIKVLKAAVAVAALGVLAAVAGAQLAPGLPLASLLWWSALGTALVVGAVLLAAVFTASLGQYILRKGGTDPQWFWFAAEPPGLLGLRKQIADLACAGTR